MNTLKTTVFSLAEVQFKKGCFHSATSLKATTAIHQFQKSHNVKLRKSWKVTILFHLFRF